MATLESASRHFDSVPNGAQAERQTNLHDSIQRASQSQRQISSPLVGHTQGEEPSRKLQ